MADDAEESLTGIWQGRYYDNDGVPVDFTATLLDLSGAISGSTHEKIESVWVSRTLHALLDGQVGGSAISFVKTYQGAPFPWTAPVLYEGEVSRDRLSITGTWTVGDASDVAFGGFQMQRPRRKSETVTRREEAKA